MVLLGEVTYSKPSFIQRMSGESRLFLQTCLEILQWFYWDGHSLWEWGMMLNYRSGVWKTKPVDEEANSFAMTADNATIPINGFESMWKTVKSM